MKVDVVQHKVHDNFQFRKSPRGSVTVEAAIVLPVVLFLFMSLFSLVQMLQTYQTVQHCLVETARRLSGYSYLYHLSGLHALSDGVTQRAAADKESLYSDWNEICQNMQDTAAWLTGSGVNEGGETIRIANNLESMEERLKEGLKNPSQELASVMSVLGSPYLSTLRNETMGWLGDAMLTRLLQEELGLGEGVTLLTYGISEDIHVEGFSVFEEDDTFELRAVYNLKGKGFGGIWPAFPACNRVKVVAWLGGEGSSIRNWENAGQDLKTDSESTTDSLWNQYDNQADFLGRGDAIESLLSDGIPGVAGQSIIPEGHYYPGADAFVLHPDASVTAVQVFSLNPYRTSYENNHNRVGARMRANLLKMDALTPEIVREATSGVGEGEFHCILVMVIPENAESWVDGEFLLERERMLAAHPELEDVVLVRSFGHYIEEEALEME